MAGRRAIVIIALRTEIIQFTALCAHLEIVAVLLTLRACRSARILLANFVRPGSALVKGIGTFDDTTRVI